jgi:hypothetical protein
MPVAGVTSSTSVAEGRDAGRASLMNAERPAGVVPADGEAAPAASGRGTGGPAGCHRRITGAPSVPTHRRRYPNAT